MGLRVSLNKLMQLGEVFVLDIFELKLDVDLILIPLNSNRQRFAKLLLLVVRTVIVYVLLEARQHLSLLLFLLANA